MVETSLFPGVLINLDDACYYREKIIKVSPLLTTFCRDEKRDGEKKREANRRIKYTHTLRERKREKNYAT